MAFQPSMMKSERARINIWWLLTLGSSAPLFVQTKSEWQAEKTKEWLELDFFRKKKAFKAMTLKQ